MVCSRFMGVLKIKNEKSFDNWFLFILLQSIAHQILITLQIEL